MSSYEESRPLEQRVVSIEAIRQEIEDNPNLTEEEVEAIENATDDQIADALRANWHTVEDLFFQAHDTLQSMATAHLLIDFKNDKKEKEG